MKVSLESIKKLTKINISNDELIPKICSQIGQVEEIEDLEKKYSGILIGQIVEKHDHPDSEKLGVFQVKIGKETVQVVAGDKSLEIGDKVAYFPPGSKIPYNPHPEKNENVIQKTLLRGVESNGMLASSRELDFGADHTKVLRLDSDSQVGQTLGKAYKLDDIVLSIENKTLADRGDCFGLLGIAREISAIQGLPFTSPDWYANIKKDTSKSNATHILNVENNSQVNCPRYMAVVLSDIQIKDSPLWMQIELVKAGIKPINNVVDITNYVMLITSQPMHAFDYNKVLAKDIHSNGTVFITIRLAKNGEKILGINDKEIELDDTMTVICDSTNPIALAGVIGGKDTQIDEKTNTIILESANFSRYNIRKTSWKTGIATEAVTRYTKKQDPNQCEKALNYAITLLSEFANAKVSSEIEDNYLNKIEAKTIYIDCTKLCTTIGIHLSNEEIKTILENIDYSVENDGNQLKVTAPTFRQDINIAEDIYEDVARIYGYNNIQITLPTRSLVPPKRNDFLDMKWNIRNILSTQGANELLTYNFVSKQQIIDWGFDLENAFHLSNALSSDLEYMRISLLPSLFEKMKENLERGFKDQALFEINIGHNKKEIDSNSLPIERWVLSFVRYTSKQKNTSSYYDAKVYFDTLIQKLNIENIKFELLSQTTKKDLPDWVYQRSAMFNVNRSAIISVLREGKKYYIGILGEISNNVKKTTNLTDNISCFEIDLHEIFLSISTVSRYHEPSKYPKIVQDICFSMDANTPYSSIVEEIGSVLASTHLLTTLNLLDIYSNPQTSDLKQLTFRISLQSVDKTLEGFEFEKVKKKLSYVLNEKFSATVI